MKETDRFRFTLTDADLHRMHLRTKALQAASQVDRHLRRRAADEVYESAVRAFHFAGLFLDAE